jgi:hypothetical protein
MKSLLVDPYFEVKQSMLIPFFSREAQFIFATRCLPRYIIKSMNVAYTVFCEFLQEFRDKIEDPFLLFFSNYLEKHEQLTNISEKTSAHDIAHLLELTWMIQATKPENVILSNMHLSSREQALFL